LNKALAADARASGYYGVFGMRWRSLGMVVTAALAGCSGRPPLSTAPSVATSGRGLPALTGGRRIRIAADWGLAGPSPEIRIWTVGRHVSGAMVVWYRAFDSVAVADTTSEGLVEWQQLSAYMKEMRARYREAYGCLNWERGDADGPAWLCHVPARPGVVDWAELLRRVDSLVAAWPGPEPQSASVDSTLGSNGQWSASRITGCLDGSGWTITLWDRGGMRQVQAPHGLPGCPPTSMAGRRYDAAGWSLLNDTLDRFASEARKASAR
jgi:hypothetical protein